MAQSWEISPDGLTYTFHLRPEAKWSNGTPLVAAGFRQQLPTHALTQARGGVLLLPVGAQERARATTRARCTDFGEVGVHALDDHTLRLDLEHPAPYLLNLIAGRTWYPVYLPAIEKTGAADDRGNQRWTLPDSFVGNGAVRAHRVVARQAHRREEKPAVLGRRATPVSTRSTSIRSTTTTPRNAPSAPGSSTRPIPSTIPPAKIDVYRRDHPELLRVPPYMGSYYFMLNITKAPLDDVRVRRALAMTVDREAIVKNVTRAGQLGGEHLRAPGHERLRLHRPGAVRSRGGAQAPRRGGPSGRRGPAARRPVAQHLRAEPADRRGASSRCGKRNWASP